MECEVPDKLYPSLVDEEAIKVAAQEATQKERTRFMKDKQIQLINKLEHYKKIKRRWTLLKNVSEGIGVTISSVCGVLTIVATSGVLGIPIIVFLTTSGGMITTLITTITNKSFINKRRSSIKNKYLNTKEVLDNLQIYFLKAKQDGIISVEEMKDFERILHKYAPLEYVNVPENNDFLEQLNILIQEHSRHGIYGHSKHGHSKKLRHT